MHFLIADQAELMMNVDQTLGSVQSNDKMPSYETFSENYSNTQSINIENLGVESLDPKDDECAGYLEQMKCRLALNFQSRNVCSAKGDQG